MLEQSIFPNSFFSANKIKGKKIQLESIIYSAPNVPLWDLPFLGKEKAFGNKYNLKFKYANTILCVKMKIFADFRIHNTF